VLLKLETTEADLQRNQADRIVSINPSLSCNALKNKLKKKGIDTSIINEAVIFDVDKEIANALLAIESKHKTIRAKNIHEYRQKLFSFLRSREFDGECIKTALTQFFSNKEN